jgi:hypothetical protein
MFALTSSGTHFSINLIAVSILNLSSEFEAFTQNELDNAIRDNIYECYDIYERFLEKEKQSSLFLYFQDDKVGMVSKRYYEMSVLNILKE